MLAHDDRKNDMKLLNSILAFILMAGVTLGIANVPHAIYYECPQLAFSRWHRDDLVS